MRMGYDDDNGIGKFGAELVCCVDSENVHGASLVTAFLADFLIDLHLCLKEILTPCRISCPR